MPRSASPSHPSPTSPWPSPPFPPSPRSRPSPSPTRSPFPPPLRLPRPLGTDAPATCEVPQFPPVRVRGGRYQLQRLVRHRRRAIAAGLAVTAAALVAAGLRTTPEAHHAEQARGHPITEPVRRHAAVETVTAPVRIADAAAVRLLRPGDRVDVIAAEDPSAGGVARVLARGARVTKVPEPLEGGAAESGALVVLSVPRATAARLVGASTTARLAVTLC
ncbi:hypothetical protein [Streptomyces sp. NPDC001250]|uniref:hypothetical protein n=1 Tax=unclassified Streptomyces TaxID=2593676 RepID=UPI003321451F